MTDTLFEIVELKDGEIVLRRANDDGDPLLSISFSEEALYFLNNSKFEVAKLMIEAGLEAASDPQELDETEDDFDEASTPEGAVFH
ncbi:MAG: hypothetical protein ACI93R_004175 [Flavobacteriales bacterium]|jgi:hypothetical protein